MTFKVLVCSASPSALSHNAALTSYVGRGFAETLSKEQVRTCSYEYSVEAAARFGPDLVVVFGSCLPANCDYRDLRTYCTNNHAILAFWLHDDPYEFDFDDKIFSYADFIFSNDKWSVTHFNRGNVFHLALAADRQAHFRPVTDDLERDVFFCGVGFANRQQLLEDCVFDLAPFKVEIFGDEWPETLDFCRNMRIANDRLPDYHARSLVTLNIGRRHSLANRKYQLDATTPGPRTFEAAMSGTVQCVYLEGLELVEYFVLEEEVLVFDSPADLAMQIAELRDDPVRRRRLAAAAQARALRDHTYANRARELLDRCGFRGDGQAATDNATTEQTSTAVLVG
jgi:spore maturation protein CgeB